MVHIKGTDALFYTLGYHISESRWYAYILSLFDTVTNIRWKLASAFCAALRAVIRVYLYGIVVFKDSYQYRYMVVDFRIEQFRRKETFGKSTSTPTSPSTWIYVLGTLCFPNCSFQV